MRRFSLLAQGLLTACFLGLAAQNLAAVEIVPATMDDIMNALGPDAKGLRLTQDSLPDMFTLTASRIEENANKFVVESRYTTGRWKGGKAVIEYARDLSYTLVSVYDKDGHRQRLYSVRTTYSEHVSQAQSKPESSPVPSTPKSAENSAPPASSPRRQPNPTTGAAVSSSPSGEKKVNFEWSEAKAAYVPVEGSEESVPAVDEEPASSPSSGGAAVSPAASATPKEQASGTAPARHKRHHPATESSGGTEKSVSEPSAADNTTLWTPTKKSDASAAKVKVAGTTWVEKPSDTSTPPVTHHKHKHKAAAPATSSETPVVVASLPAQQPAASATSATPTHSDNPAATTTNSHDQWVPSGAEPAAGRAVEDNVPSTEELLNGPEAKTDRTPVAAAHPRTAAPVIPTPAPETAPVPETVPHPRHAAQETRHTSAPPPPATEPPAAAVPAPAQNAVPSTEELLANDSGKSGPDTSESDSWTPKAVPKPVVKEPVAPPEPVKVAMVPKPAPVDNSVENLLKISDQSKSSMPHESEAWVPKNAQPVKSEVDLNKELERIQAQEKLKATAPKPQPKIHKDVNNPEEGVLPVSSFEKFSGPMYGRHREYERRFVPGKIKSAKVPEHDFYVDEVDRKKEIHNIYYYIHQKGKAPKLVALERHEQVSFLGNYDIEKESKGKISIFH